MELPAPEFLDAGVIRDEGLVPGAGRVDDCAGEPAAAVGGYAEEIVRRFDPGDADRAQDRKGEPLFVFVEIIGHEFAGRLSASRRWTIQVRHSHVGKGGDAVDIAHSERLPSMLPRSTGVIVGVENKMVDAKAQQVKRRGKPGLTGADDDVVEDLHRVFNNRHRRAVRARTTRSRGVLAGFGRWSAQSRAG